MILLLPSQHPRKEKLMHFPKSKPSLALVQMILVGLFLCLATITQAQPLETITAISWSHDGNKLASANAAGIVQIRDILSGAITIEIQGHLGEITEVSWKPDDTQIATASPDDKVVRIWDVQTGALITELLGDRYYEGRAHVLWKPDGHGIVTLAPVTDGGSFLHFWGVEGNNYLPLSVTYNVSALDIKWSPDGTILAVADIRGLYLFDDFSAETLTPRIIAPQRVTIAWSPDGTKLAGTEAQTGKIEILDVTTGTVLTVIQRPAPSAERVDFAAMSWSLDGQTLIIYDFDGSLQTWSAVTGELIATINTGLGAERYLMALSPFGGRVALGGTTALTQAAQTEELGQIVQLMAGGAIQIIVPNPSFDLLRSVANACNAPSTVKSELPLSGNQLSAFVSEIKSLSGEAVPSACAADLIAVAEALQTR